MRNLLKLALENDQDTSVQDFKDSFSKMLDQSGVLPADSQEDQVAKELADGIDQAAREQAEIDNHIGQLADMRDALTSEGRLVLESLDLDLTSLIGGAAATAAVSSEEGEETGRVNGEETRRRLELATESIASTISQKVKQAWDKLLEMIKKLIAWVKNRIEYNQRHYKWEKYARWNFSLNVLAHKYLSEVKFEDLFESEVLPNLSAVESMWLDKGHISSLKNIHEMEWIKGNMLDDMLDMHDKVLAKYVGKDDIKMSDVSNELDALESQMNKAKLELGNNRLKSFGSWRDIYGEKEFTINSDIFKMGGKSVDDYVNKLKASHKNIHIYLEMVQSVNINQYVQLLTKYEKDVEEASKKPDEKSSLVIQSVRSKQVNFLMQFLRGYEKIQQELYGFFTCTKKICNWIIHHLDLEIKDMKADTGHEPIRVRTVKGGETSTLIEYYEKVKVEMENFLKTMPA